MRKAPWPAEGAGTHRSDLSHMYSKANGNRSHGSVHATSTVIVRRRCGKVGTFRKGTVALSCVVFGKYEENLEGRVSSNINKQQFTTSPVSALIFLQHVEITVFTKRIAGLEATKHKRFDFARYVSFVVFPTRLRDSSSEARFLFWLSSKDFNFFSLSPEKLWSSILL